jgi:hypothetical protein
MNPQHSTYNIEKTEVPGALNWILDVYCENNLQGAFRRSRSDAGNQEHGTGKFREPANKNVCATPRVVAQNAIPLESPIRRPHFMSVF